MDEANNITKTAYSKIILTYYHEVKTAVHIQLKKDEYLVTLLTLKQQPVKMPVQMGVHDKSHP